MKKRVFVGLEISEEAREKVSKYIQALREAYSDLRVGWEKREKLHLTLKYLGEIEDDELAKLMLAVKKTARQVSLFSPEIRETGVFPHSSKARVLWIGVKDKTKKIFVLNDVLEKECENQGFQRESRKFKAHLTVARLREPQNSGELVERHLSEQFEPVGFKVSEIVIFQSKLQPTGSIYSRIDSFPLKSEKQS